MYIFKESKKHWKVFPLNFRISVLVILIRKCRISDVPPVSWFVFKLPSWLLVIRKGGGLRLRQGTFRLDNWENSFTERGCGALEPSLEVLKIHVDVALTWVGGDCGLILHSVVISGVFSNLHDPPVTL